MYGVDVLLTLGMSNSSSIGSGGSTTAAVTSEKNANIGSSSSIYAKIRSSLKPFGSFYHSVKHKMVLKYDNITTQQNTNYRRTCHSFHHEQLRVVCCLQFLFFSVSLLLSISLTHNVCDCVSSLLFICQIYSI